MRLRTTLYLAGSLGTLLLLIGLAWPPRMGMAAGEYTAFLPLVVGPPATPEVETGVITASYLGGSNDDTTVAAGIGSDGSSVIAGNWPGYNPGDVTPISLLDGGDAALLRIAPDGQSVQSMTRIGGEISDMEINGDGAIVACGDFGVAVLNNDASELAWSAKPTEIRRCSIGADGSVAALAGDTIYLYAADGSAMNNWQAGGKDIAIDSTNELVFVTGYTQKGKDLKVAFLFAFDYAGAKSWIAYDFAAGAVKDANLDADSEGRKLAMGADGKLYFAGWVDGGNAIYTRDPQDISRKLSKDELIKIDDYSNPYNISGSKSLAWYARFEPASGKVLLAQWMLTRLSSGSGNSIGIEAIAADAAGNVYLAGATSASIKNRSELVFAGVPVGNYEGSEPYFAAVSSDFQERQVWTAFAAPDTSAGGSPANGVAVRDGVVTIAATLNPSDKKQRGLITYKAMQAELADPASSEGYVVIWKLR